MIYICLGQNMLRFFFMNKEKTVSKLRKVTIRKNHPKRSTWYLSQKIKTCYFVDYIKKSHVSFPYDLHILATLKKV